MMPIITDESSNKPNFVLTLLAVAITLITFKDELNNATILIGIWHITLLHLALTFTTLLGLSAYFYAFDYLRSYKWLQKARFIASLANFFFLIAIMFPIIILFAWILSYALLDVLASYIVHSPYKQFIYELTGFIMYSLGFVTGYKAYVWAKRLTKEAEQKSARKQDELTQQQLERATQLYNEKIYGPAIIEIYNIMKARLKSALTLKGYRINTIPTKQLLLLATKERLITQKDMTAIWDIKKMKEQAVHFGTFNKKDADFALNVAKEILKKTAD